MYDEQINRLTVVANETFESFAKGLQSDIEAAIDPSGGFRFGRVPKLAFTPLLHADGTRYLSQDESAELWQHIKQRGYIDANGDFTPSFRPERADFSLQLPYQFSGMDEPVVARLKKFLPRDFAKDARKRQPVAYNKRVELNPDFKELWARISQRTRYSVEFKTDELVKLAVGKIKSMAETKAVQIEITKRDLEIRGSRDRWRKNNQQPYLYRQYASSLAGYFRVFAAGNGIDPRYSCAHFERVRPVKRVYD